MEMHNLCVTCLSADRKLVLIRENAIYSWFFDKSTEDERYICWECQALLVKMARFKAQVLQAQQMMKTWTELKPKQTLSLSSLSNQTKTSYDYCYEYSIKTELNTELQTFDTDCNDVLDNDSCSISDEFQEQNFGSNNWTKVEPEFNQIKQNDDDDSFIEAKPNIICCISDIKSEGVATAKNKSINSGKQYYNKDKIIVLTLSEEEMLKNREIDRNSRRYKACTYRCDKCIMGYYDEQKYEKHIKDKHSEQAGKHVCRICEVRFSRAEYNNRHVSAHYRGYRCRLCTYTHHRLRAVLIHHAREHEGETKYVCVACEKIFDNKRSLRYHRDKVHRELPKCQLCEKTFSSNASLKTHVSTHTTSVAMHRCPTCSRTYKSVSSLRAHTRTHRAARDERAYCAPCDTQFRNVSLYARHVAEHRAHRDEHSLKIDWYAHTRTQRTARDERAYCAPCDTQFRNVSRYARHVAEHRAHRDAHSLKFSCGQCDARFANKSYLKRHEERMHLKVYPHACALCHKRFAARDRLKTHVKEVHEGVPRPKDKICSYCGKGFAKRSTLTNHIRVHTGERPHVCAQCDASFTQKSALNAHVRALHARTGENRT